MAGETDKLFFPTVFFQHRLLKKKSFFPVTFCICLIRDYELPVHMPVALHHKHRTVSFLPHVMQDPPGHFFLAPCNNAPLPPAHSRARFQTGHQVKKICAHELLQRKGGRGVAT